MSTKIPRNVYITNTIKERLADGLVDKLRQLHRARPSIRLIKIPRRAAVGNIAARHWSLTDAACPLRALRWAPVWVRRCAAALSYGEISV